MFNISWHNYFTDIITKKNICVNLWDFIPLSLKIMKLLSRNINFWKIFKVLTSYTCFIYLSLPFSFNASHIDVSLSSSSISFYDLL